MRLLPSAFFVALVALSTSCLAGSLGDKFDSYRDLHERTAYWSLFFNEGAIRYRDSRNRKRFQAVVGGGHIELPQQQGFCFVFNHYTDDPGLIRTNRKYRAEIEKLFNDGSKRVEVVERPFSPTDDVYSSNLPDVCVSAFYNVTSASIKFSTDDGNPARDISFNTGQRALAA